MPTATPAATAPPVLNPLLPCGSLGLGLLLATLCLGGCGTAELPAAAEAAPMGPSRQPLPLADTCTGRVPVEGTPEALGMLAFLNSTSASLQVLNDQVPLDSRAAHNLVARRNGPDGLQGTADDQPFRSLAEVDAVGYVGNEALAALTAYARSTDWILLEDAECVGTFESVVFTAGHMRRVLALANQANATFLDVDVALDRRTVDGLVAGRLFPHIRALADSFWVGPTHMQLLANYAAQEFVPGELCHHRGACESVHMECIGFASNDWGRCRDLVPIPGEGSVCPQNSYCGPGLFCAGDRICRPGWMSETLFETTDVSLPASVSTQAAPFLMVMGQAETPVDLEVQVDLNHPSPGDLRIWLVNPPMDDRVLPPLLLWDGPNAGGQAFQPRLPVYSGISRGEYVNGPWELRIENVTGTHAGTLKGWTMRVTSRW